MAGQIDGIGDDGGGGIGLRSRFRQHRDGIGDAERKTAAVPAAGRNAPRGIVGVDHDRAQKAMAIGPIHQADGELFALTQMQRDIAAIVDVSALEPRRRQHGAKDFFRDGARHRRHRRDEAVGGKRRDRRMHPARDDALQRARRGSAAERNSLNSSQSSSSKPAKRRAAAS